MRKPDTCFYEHVLREMSIVPAEAIFVDDKEENVSGAQKVGMMGFVFDESRASEFREELLVP
ncbi:uncharacterized protein N7483_010351 [Penicillium malachiteum]|uniref:uncharacterized protein n=1 Tax=Penicillium malachiteum TaxID=1324776 RepID=UPI002548D3C7|nr:uncharacterized protein N7483_010351 [Penicillium malachiteum]KAJ5713170.1 hypothetical protein N7483_010351 [Penicillium malachiteum]